MRKPAPPPKPDAPPPQIEVEDDRRPRFGLPYPAQPPQPPPARRGRPPKPGGPMPQVEVQRAYRARLKAQGRDPATQTQLIAEFRDQLHGALVKLELQAQDVARLEDRNRFLESELVRLEREATQAAKDRITARREAAAHLKAPRARPAGRRPVASSDN
jgi:hypothetical protein